MSRLSRYRQRASRFLSGCIACIRASARQTVALIVPVRYAWVRLTTGLVLVCLASWLVYAGYSEWRKTVTMTNSCNRVPADWPNHHFRYLQLYIDSQRLRGPIFDGRYFINLGSKFGRNPLQLTIIQAGSPNYAATTLRPTFHWDDGFPNLMMQDNHAEMAFVSKSSAHYMFPFDSARFDETFTFEPPPPIDINAVLLSNRVAGFYMPCDTIAVHTETGSAKVSFELRRNPLIVYTAVLLLVIAALSAMLITLFVEAGPLPGALASYFFAVWTIRTLFGLTAEGFPTQQERRSEGAGGQRVIARKARPVRAAATRGDGTLRRLAGALYWIGSTWAIVGAMAMVTASVIWSWKQRLRCCAGCICETCRW
jgi:hypothetical protein